MSRQVVKTVEKLVLPILEAQNLELVEVEYKKEGQNWFLRVFIDREDRGVNLDDCTAVSEQLSEKLDELDPIPGAYILEVSSPGAERPLKKTQDFQKAIGKYVHISTYEPIKGRKVFEGVLTEYGEEHLTVEVNNESIELPLAKVAKARLAIVF